VTGEAACAALDFEFEGACSGCFLGYFGFFLGFLGYKFEVGLFKISNFLGLFRRIALFAAGEPILRVGNW
jgi:hypothetical protein